MKRVTLLSLSHLLVLVIGFAGGIYLLPILSAPPAPSGEAVQQAAAGAQWTGEFRRDLADSDALHWGEGTLHVGRDAISLDGKIAPGPAYMLYLSREFVETEADFLRLKAGMANVGDVKTFDNFVVQVPPGIDPGDYTTAIVWCESFDQFITAAQYR